MSRDLLDNPLGTDGFEFVEFTGPDPQAIARQFEAITHGGALSKFSAF